MKPLERSIAACRIAAETLEQSLREVLPGTQPISEVELCNLWLKKIRKHTSIYPDGWYVPPPHGMFVQFGTTDKPDRVNQTSNRIPKAWPRSDIFLDRQEGIISAYASPVDRTSGLIGDFSITLYFGDNADIHSLLKQTLDMDIALYKKLKVGMEYATLAKECAKYMEKHNMYNAIASVNDPAGTNIGHTIPASEKGWSQAELKIFKAGDWEAISNLISRKRLFISTLEHTRITETCAHTVEPRPLVIDRPDLPMVNFHTMVVWQGGHKQLVTCFGDLFRLAGMDYMFDENTIPFLK